MKSSSPAIGSYYGGTILTIVGENFSPTASDNNVFIDEEYNLNCPVIKSTTTEI